MTRAERPRCPHCGHNLFTRIGWETYRCVKCGEKMEIDPDKSNPPILAKGPQP